MQRSTRAVCKSQYSTMARRGRMSPYGALCLLGILVGFTKFTRSDEVVLLDTRKLESLNWQTNPQNPSNAQHRGWREASYPVDNGDIYRVYYACNVAQQSVHNWIRLPYVERKDANRLYIDINFTMRKCELYPDPRSLYQCKESFKLLYYEADSDFANINRPTWDTQTYSHIDVIAADRTISKNVNAFINTETRSVAVTKKGIYFAMYDEGACTTMISIRIYYKMCTSKTVNFATFPNTTTGKESTEVVQRYGTCVNHAAIKQQPKALCMADGKWSYFEGGCKCMPGYEPQGGTTCKACLPGTYKWDTGDSGCESCPAFSEAKEPGAVECRCLPGYYRSINDDKSRPCTRPPSKPRNVTVVFFDQTTVVIDWVEPETLGGRNDLSYRITCYPCRQSESCLPCDSSVTYNPQWKAFSTSKVTVQGLNPDTFYTFQVFAENGVTGAHSELVYQNVSVLTTPALPEQVSSVHIASVGLNTVTLVWSRPSDARGRTELYEVKWYPTYDRKNASSDQIHHENYTFQNLQFQTEYSFQVRHKTDIGWGKFTEPVRTTTGRLLEKKNDITSQRPEQDNPIPIIAGSIVAVAMCMAIVIVMVVIFLRRNHRSHNEKPIIHCPPIEGTQVIHGTLTVPLFTPPPGGIRTYVDPHTYEDPNQAVREFTKEIDASCIMIESVIGGGEFGDVCKGRLRVAMRGELAVAIKTLKVGASDKNRLDFLTEASIMGQFEDPNVIYLEGVVTKSNPIMIVTEFMQNGSLDTFLRNNDGKFTVMQLVGMMRGIASGMRYLSDMGYIHRDLAARNILVNENLVCKVADFGLSREIETDTTDGAYTTKGGKIPVRWTAPEAIAYRKFTWASDVWSYGVVMWEVMSYGERPYWNWSNQDVIKAVDRSFRLPPPMDCPDALHQLMLDCWQKERGDRPKFGGIVKTLDKLIRAPELLRKLAKQKPCNYFDPNMPDMTQIGSIEEWLIGIKMERYIEYFVSAGYLTMDQIAQISLKDLMDLGITLVGHQKKILNSVQTLRAQMDCGSTEQLVHGLLV